MSRMFKCTVGKGIKFCTTVQIGERVFLSVCLYIKRARGCMSMLTVSKIRSEKMGISEVLVYGY